MEDLKDWQIYFNDRNSLIFRKNGKITHRIAIPPCINGCDIISFNEKFSEGYTYNFKGFVIFTTEFKRVIYYKGQIVDEF